MASYPETATLRQLKIKWNDVGNKYRQAGTITIQRIKQTIQVLKDERDKIKEEIKKNNQLATRLKRVYRQLKKEYRFTKEVVEKLDRLEGVIKGWRSEIYKSRQKDFLRKTSAIRGEIDDIAKRTRDLFAMVDKLEEEDKNTHRELKEEVELCDKDLKILEEVLRFLEAYAGKKQILTKKDIENIKARVRKVREDTNIRRKISIKVYEIIKREEDITKTFQIFEEKISKIFHDITSIEEEIKRVIR